MAARLAELVEGELAVLVGVGGGKPGAAVGEELRLGKMAVARHVDRLECRLEPRQLPLQLRPARFAGAIDGAAQRRLARVEGEVTLASAVEPVEARGGEA